MEAIAERAYLIVGGSTPAKPNGCGLTEKIYANIGSTRTKVMCSLMGIPITLPIFNDDFINENPRLVPVTLNIYITKLEFQRISKAYIFTKQLFLNHSKKVVV
jgi:hypothetical protein